MTRRFLGILLALALGSGAQAQVGSWDGYYMGLTASSVGMTVEDLSYGPEAVDLSGIGYGAFIGMNKQVNSLVFGVEATMEIETLSGSDGVHLNPFSVNSTIALRGRLGMDAGKVMPYVLVGFVTSGFEADHEADGANIANNSAAGITYGAGIDLHLNRQNNRFLRFEFQTTDYGDSTLTYNGSDNHDIVSSSQRVSVGYGISF